MRYTQAHMSACTHNEYLERKVNNTARKKIFAEQWQRNRSSRIRATYRSRDDVPGISFPVPPILTDAYKMHRYRVHDLLTFAIDISSNLRNFQAEASSRGIVKGYLWNYLFFFFFFFEQSPRRITVTIILVNLVIIIRIITQLDKNAFAMFPR